MWKGLLGGLVHRRGRRREDFDGGIAAWEQSRKAPLAVQQIDGARLTLVGHGLEPDPLELQYAGEGMYRE